MKKRPRGFGIVGNPTFSKYLPHASGDEPKIAIPDLYHGGIYPTRVGMNLTPEYLNRRARDLPHASGDEPGASPLLVGARCSTALPHASGDEPSRRLSTDSKESVPTIPYASGDEPQIDRLLQGFKGSTPREWG